MDSNRPLSVPRDATYLELSYQMDPDNAGAFMWKIFEGVHPLPGFDGYVLINNNSPYSSVPVPDLGPQWTSPTWERLTALWHDSLGFLDLKRESDTIPIPPRTARLFRVVQSCTGPPPPATRIA